MNHTRAEKFFTIAEQERIRLAVAAAETTTDGEIATMLVWQSDSYRELKFLAAALASLITLPITLLIDRFDIITSLSIFAVSAFIFHRLTDFFPEPSRRFIPAPRMDLAVRARAIEAFYEKGLYKTRNATGILIFISIFEHKVWILGDSGINEKIPQERWQELVSSVAAGVRDGCACSAICQVISLCGIELSSHFPKLANETNELSDELQFEQ